MAGETLGTIQRTIARRYGQGNSGNLGDDVKDEVRRCVNLTLHAIHVESENRFLRRTVTIRNQAKKLGGVGGSIANGDTVFSTTSAPWFTDAMLGQDLSIDGSEIPYVITEVRNNSSVSISPAFAGATTSTATFDVTWGHLLMPEDFAALGNVTDIGRDCLLKPVSISEVRRRLGAPRNEGASYASIYALDQVLDVVVDNVRGRRYSLLLAYAPSAQVDFLVDYQKLPAELEDSDDVPDIPIEFHQMLLEGAWVRFAEGFAARDARSLETSKASFRSALKRFQSKRETGNTILRPGSYRDMSNFGSTRNIPPVDVDII